MRGSVVAAVLMIAITDVSLQLDNALAISSVASAMKPSQRLLALGGGVGMAAVCLFAFTALGTALIDRFAVLRLLAGLLLLLVGLQLIAAFFHVRLPLPWP